MYFRKDHLDIKQRMLIILTGRTNILTLTDHLAFIGDVSGIASFDEGAVITETSPVKIFIENSIDFLEEEDYDGWVEYLKGELLYIENYELLNFLEI